MGAELRGNESSTLSAGDPQHCLAVHASTPASSARVSCRRSSGCSRAPCTAEFQVFLSCPPAAEGIESFSLSAVLPYLMQTAFAVLHLEELPRTSLEWWLQATAEGRRACLSSCSAAAMHMGSAPWDVHLAALSIASSCYLHRNLLRVGNCPHAGLLPWHSLKEGASGRPEGGCAELWPDIADWAILTAHQHAARCMCPASECCWAQQLSSHACRAAACPQYSILTCLAVAKQCL